MRSALVQTGVATLALALLASATSGAAQDVPALAPGARVRVTVASRAPDGRAGRTRTLVGRLRAASDTSLTLEAPRGKLRELSLADVRGAKVSVAPGTRGRTTAIGAAIGFGAGATLAYASWEDCSGELICFDRGEVTMLGGGLGLLAGALMGLVAGRGERWAEVPVPASRRASATPFVAPVSGRIGVGVALQF